MHIMTVFSMPHRPSGNIRHSEGLGSGALLEPREPLAPKRRSQIQAL